VRIEGTVEGEIAIQGLVVIGETGKVTCQTLQAETVIVAGAVKGNIRCGKLEIRATGRVWGDVVTTALSSEEGAFLRGQVRMEEKVEVPPVDVNPAEEAYENLPDEGQPSADQPPA
jgi:cytoskeletal protein CcmA (bactofilin family)